MLQETDGTITIEAQGGEDLLDKLDRLERTMEEHRKEWHALIRRLEPLLKRAESISGRWPAWKRP